jgi:hypothetical protein
MRLAGSLRGFSPPFPIVIWSSKTLESRAPNSLKVVPLCRAIGKAPSQKKVEHRAANLIGVPE